MTRTGELLSACAFGVAFAVRLAIWEAFEGRESLGWSFAVVLVFCEVVEVWCVF